MKKYILLYLAVWLTASCSNFLEEYSQDLAKVESYGDLDELLIGDAYWRTVTAFTQNSYTNWEGEPYLLALHLMSDETELYRKAEGDHLYLLDDMFGWMTWQQQVGRNYKGSDVISEDKDWNELYRRINIANQVINAIDDQAASTEKEELEKIRIKGEAHFLRAIYYFTLVNMYARPYKPETATTEPGIPVKWVPQIEDRDYESTPLAEVYTAILEDLGTARQCLSQTSIKNHPYRADIVAAHLLTSRVYLYMQDWQNAYNHADSVIQRKGGLVNLEDHTGETSDILNRSSVETIFSMGGHILAPTLYGKRSASNEYPGWTISKNLVDLYGPEGDNNDLRRGIYIRQITPVIWSSKGTPIWVFNKIDGPKRYVNGRIACDVGDFFLMRTAEAYLNAAEAAAQMDKNGDAVRMLQTLRSHRVKSENATYGSGSDLIKFIREERERELCLEGHRWFDLRRYMADSRYPFTKSITHYYTDFNAETPDGSYQTMQYVLEENDAAYTLALPKEVTDFQNTLHSVSRPGRIGMPYNEYAGLDFWELGYEDGRKAGQEVGLEDYAAGNTRRPTYRNPEFYRYYNGDYNQFDDYGDAYEEAFEEAYLEVYPDHKEAGFTDGFLAARKDYRNNDYKGSAYHSDFNTANGTEDYKTGFDEAYDLAFRDIAEIAKEDGEAAAIYDYDHWYGGSTLYSKKNYFPDDEKAIYNTAFWDAYDAKEDELYGD